MVQGESMALIPVPEAVDETIRLADAPVVKAMAAAAAAMADILLRKIDKETFLSGCDGVGLRREQAMCQGVNFRKNTRCSKCLCHHL